MRPMRGFGGRGGGGLPGLDTTAAKLTAAFVVGSALFLLAARIGNQAGLLLLWPDAVFRQLFLWQPLTYAFIEDDPISIIFGAILLWSIGGWLEQTWGSKRLLVAAVGCTALAGILTALLSFFIILPGGYRGGWVMCSVLWVAYGLTIGRGETNFWGIPLSGNAFAAIGVGFVVLRILTIGFYSQIPQVLALLLVFAYVRGANPRRLMLHFQHWRLQRQLRDRSKHLRVVPKNQNRPDRDQYLN